MKSGLPEIPKLSIWPT